MRFPFNQDKAEGSYTEKGSNQPNEVHTGTSVSCVLWNIMFAFSKKLEKDLFSAVVLFSATSDTHYAFLWVLMTLEPDMLQICDADQSFISHPL